MQLTDGPSPRFLWGFCPFIILSALQARLERKTKVEPVTQEEVHEARSQVSGKPALKTLIHLRMSGYELAE